MSRDLILGTAGHIDHGKTSLVKALTGTDTSRLPEEKARGITIDIGFAALTLGNYQLGVVDVPGHERFIRNMLAGATGIDIALLVVAADDSVMPQTREHLEILLFLGVQHGVIAITKADLVDETTLEVAMMEVRELVAETALKDAPIIVTSVTTGLGLSELKTAIEAACTKVQRTNHDSFFRLPIDRAFVLQGHGTIVTGSVLSGSVKVGDEVEWHKGDGTSEIVRLRSLNNHNRSVTELHRGQRGALNLAGVPHESVSRGQELATPGYLLPSRVLSVQITASRPIKHRLPVRFHAGTAEVMGKLSLLEDNAYAPGETGLAQLFLEEPVTVVWGQPFVLRDSSAEQTLGGGTVLQPNARKLRRRQHESVARLLQLVDDDIAVRVAAAAWFAGYEGFELRDLPRLAGLAPSECDHVLQFLLSKQKLFQKPLLIHADRFQELLDRILAQLAAIHAEQPLLTSHDRSLVLARLSDVNNVTLVEAAVNRLVEMKLFVGTDRLARTDFKPKLGANQRKLKDRIVAETRSAGLAPPEPASYANVVGGSVKSVREIYDIAVAEGLLVQIADEIYLHAETAAAAIAKVREKLQSQSKATVAEIRDWLGTTRKYAVPICEYLDRAGVTRRKGDHRVLR